MEATEHAMKSWDGAELFYRAWIPREATNKAILLFHRGHEHSGRWQQTVDLLGLKDIAVCAWDARGHGRSLGERGTANNFADVVRDVDAFARHISKRYEIPIENMIVLAHSLAAVSVAAWVHDYAPPIRAMILATAAFHVKLYVPFAIPFLRMKQKLFGPGQVKSYVKSKLLTRDREQAAQYDADPLIFRQIAVNVLLDLKDTADRLIADAGAIQTPTLMIGAGRDWVVSLKAQREFFSRLSSPLKEMEIYPVAYHAIFHDQDRDLVVHRVREFVRGRFAKPVTQPSLLNADQAGYTWDEYERLKSRGGMKFAVARAGLRAAGRLSHGVDLGWRNGFEKLHGEGHPVRILDIAAGAGRYVIETVHELPDISINVTLRDYKQENVDAARALAQEFGLENVTVERGDAFDRDSIAAIAPQATIGIVSGLYELFPRNEPILNSLRGLAGGIETGGYLIYTNQPWHPQVEFIARVLRNREGEPWIMRRRTTAEIDELVCVSGFRKMTMEVDQWGMFTVSIARRAEP